MRKYDRRFNQRVWKVLNLMLAIALVVDLYGSAFASGIYPTLRPASDSNWVHAAYSGWWANPSHHAGLFLYTIVIGVFICYYMIRNNIVGLIAVFLCCSVFRGQRHQEPVLRLDPMHPDALAGLGVLREILQLSYLSVLNSLVSLFVVYCAFGLRRSTVPVYVTFVLLNPIFVIIPALVIGRQVRHSKAFHADASRQELRRRIDVAVSDEDWMRIHVKQEWNAKIGRIPNYLFSTESVLTSFVVYYIPVVLFLDWVIKT